jgi:hypothetical protein
MQDTIVIWYGVKFFDILEEVIENKKTTVETVVD